MQQQPNRFIAPIVIAGITVGFLASAYKFIFTKPKQESKKQDQQGQSEFKSDQMNGVP